MPLKPIEEFSEKEMEYYKKYKDEYGDRLSESFIQGMASYAYADKPSGPVPQLYDPLEDAKKYSKYDEKVLKTFMELAKTGVNITDCCRISGINPENISCARKNYIKRLYQWGKAHHNSVIHQELYVQFLEKNKNLDPLKYAAAFIEEFKNVQSVNVSVSKQTKIAERVDENLLEDWDGTDIIEGEIIDNT